MKQVKLTELKVGDKIVLNESLNQNYSGESESGIFKQKIKKENELYILDKKTKY